MIGANRLFAATTRAVNRVFDIRNTKVVQVTIKSVSLATVVVVLFLLSVVLTGVIQALIRLSQDSGTVTHGLSTVVTIVLGAAATIIPAVLTTVVFSVIYYRIPDTRVQLRDAILGAIVAIILFEIGKHLFFWFNRHDTYQANIYGPITSVVVLMLWAYIASLIFLYGAALTKVAGELRQK